jgi:nucleoside-diphosphate-sugar epimerase
MQTILGAGGAIGVELAKDLAKYTENIRLVSRNPKKINEKDELITANLLKPHELNSAVRGSEIVYSVVGFPYKYKLWKTHWPMYTQNLIDACIENNCKLVFFDNIYMYDQDHLNGMTEETPINPSSKKGKVRAEVLKMVMDKVEEGKLTALIARAADFYGPGITNTSILTETVFNTLSNGKKASWFGAANFRHSFTYTPDAGKATALLGNSEEAYNKVWHLPTAGNPPTGKEWIEMIAAELGVKPRYQVANRFMVGLLGLFVPIMKELREMLYQYDRDYVFNSDKFEKAFGMKPTPYQEGVREIVEKDYRK